jgi:hypothetical protein
MLFSWLMLVLALVIVTKPSYARHLLNSSTDTPSFDINLYEEFSIMTYAVLVKPSRQLKVSVQSIPIPAITAINKNNSQIQPRQSWYSIYGRRLPQKRCPG